jgi:hypothetical protein
MTQLENSIEKSFVRKMKELRNVECFKFEPQGIAGYPDRLVVLSNGRVVWVEFKRPGGELEPLQKFRIKRLQSLGHRVNVYESAEEAAHWVRFLANQ